MASWTKPLLIGSLALLGPPACSSEDGCQEIAISIDPVVIPAAGPETVDVVVRIEDGDGRPASGVTVGLTAFLPELPTGILMAHGISGTDGTWVVHGSDGVHAVDLASATQLGARHGNSSLDKDAPKFCEARTRIDVIHERSRATSTTDPGA